MKMRKVAALAIAGSLAAVPFTSMAQYGAGGGFNSFVDRTQAYVGGGVGWYALDDDVEVGEDGADITIDSDDIALQAFAGGKFNEWLGIEGSYVNFGEASDGDASFEADGFGIAAVGFLPLNWAVKPYAKVGQFFWEAEATGDDPVGAAVAASGDDDGNDVFWGVGGQFAINRDWGTRLEFTRYEIAESDVDTFTINALYKF